MDFGTIITELGGGLAAVVLVAMAFVLQMLWKRLGQVQDNAQRRIDELQDARYQDLKEHSAQVHDALTVLSAAVSALEDKRNV